MDAGLTRYFTGEPCKRGHVADRLVSSHNCTLCIKEAKARLVSLAASRSVPKASESSGDVSSRREALSAGFGQYFTGEPCSNGHIANRFTVNHGCVECHKKWSEDHRTSSRGKRALRASYERRRLESPETGMFYAARYRAKSANLPFNISKDDIKAAWPRDNMCPVTGMPMKRNLDKQISGASPDSPTIDRIVPELGYVKGNVAVISMRANRIKNGETDPRIIRRVADWLEAQLRTRRRKKAEI